MKAYPLADAAKPTTRYIDGYPKACKTLPTFDVSYFHLLADAIAVEPPQPKGRRHAGDAAQYRHRERQAVPA